MCALAIIRCDSWIVLPFLIFDCYILIPIVYLSSKFLLMKKKGKKWGSEILVLGQGVVLGKLGNNIGFGLVSCLGGPFRGIDLFCYRS